MSTDKTSYSKLTTVARGYADCLLAHFGFSSFVDEWDGITSSDFSKSALKTLSEDCRTFLDEAQGLHPGGKNGLRDAIKQHDLGWHFFLARQGTGVGYQNFSMGSFGDRLTELAESYGWIEVEISDKGKIHFLT